LEHLWAPWRMAYIEQAQNAGDRCILCDKPREAQDEANFILFRGRFNFVIMNAFPYNNGHLMVAPLAHTTQLSILEDNARQEHIDIVSRCADILKEALRPAGFNIGLNLGRVAGAGVDQHLHCHIVPRWEGDVNFMPVLADVRVINQAIADTYKHLRPFFA